jgi:hypothetical protein
LPSGKRFHAPHASAAMPGGRANCSDRSMADRHCTANRAMVRLAVRRFVRSNAGHCSAALRQTGRASALPQATDAVRERKRKEQISDRHSRLHQPAGRDCAVSRAPRRSGEERHRQSAEAAVGASARAAERPRRVLARLHLPMPHAREIHPLLVKQFIGPIARKASAMVRSLVRNRSDQHSTVIVTHKIERRGFHRSVRPVIVFILRGHLPGFMFHQSASIYPVEI